jgi:hypothetical protein
MVGACTLREMRAQMNYLDARCPNRAQRIVDEAGNILAENMTARQIRSRSA